uniref:Nuclear pore protein n=1 Tax=Culicoides sonorensis TaxID=179676 RepID=A0A336LSA7_CULSO
MDLNTILQQAQKLTNETKTKEELPNVERTLPQVLQATQELHNRIRKTQDFQDIQAHILLGSKGIDLPQISQKLEALSTRKTFESLDPITDTDIESFLKNERENAILSVIEEVHKASHKEAEHKKWNNIMNDWKYEKAKLMNALISPSQNWIDIRKGSEQTILNETSYGRRSALNDQERAYASIVHDYNRLVTQGAVRPSLVLLFGKEAQKFNDIKVNEIWEIMKCMINTLRLPKTQDPLRARSQCPELVLQAKKYLENRYKLYMQTVSSENLREAQRGGIPSTYNLVSSFVNIKFNNIGNATTIGLQDGLVEGKPVWPMIYYSLRSGDLQSALFCAQSTGPGNEDIIAVLEKRIRNPEYLKNSKHELQIKMLYKRQIRNTTDPYKRAVYCILGYCDINDHHPEVAKTSDDFLWIQLSLIKTPTDESTNGLTLASLQNLILEQYGETHYNAMEQPHLYFQLLALTGQFEAAIEFLFRTEKYRIHAVHIAIALNELHVLGCPRNIQEPLLSVDIEDLLPLRRLNIVRLILLYVRKFEISDPAEALQYFYFLRNMKDSEGRNVFLNCVSDLAIQSRDFDLIFGKLYSNGVRSRGLIDQFENIEIDAKLGANLVADELVKKGMFEDAINLFDLAQNKEQAIRYMSILLSQVVHQPKKTGTLRERLLIKANDMSARYTGDDLSCDSQSINTFNLLHNLGKFFDEYHENNHQYAMEILDNLNIVPANMNQLENCVNNYKKVSGEVSKVFPEVLLAAMDIIYKKYKIEKCKELNKHEFFEHKQKISYYREHAKSITNMAAMIPFRMPGDANSRLIQTEILMN